MAYDEGLAQRIRELLEKRKGVTEKQMFGGLCFMLRGHMFIGIVKRELMVRVGPERHADALRDPHARAMDFTGRPMRGYVFVEPAGVDGDDELGSWLGRALECNATLPAK